MRYVKAFRKAPRKGAQRLRSRKQLYEALREGDIQRRDGDSQKGLRKAIQEDARPRHSRKEVKEGGQKTLEEDVLR